MSKMRLVALVGALVCAVVAGILVKNMLGKRAQQAEHANQPAVTETVDVLVATRDFNMGDKLATGISWKAWPKANTTELMILRDVRADAMNEMATARVRIPIYKDEPVVMKKVLQPGVGGYMAAALPKGMRAEGVAISSKSTAGGFIMPNDRVDVIVTKKSTDAQSAAAIVRSETVITNVRVLAINQVFKQAAEGDPVAVEKGETATLELTPQQSEVLATVQNSGELSLVLRSIAENEGVAESENLPMLADKYLGKSEKGKPSSETLIIRAGAVSRAASQ